MQRRVLIAGCGYVGLALGRRLADAGHRVVGVRRTLGDPRVWRESGIEPLEADLARRSDLERLPVDWDWVVQCAAPSERGVNAYSRTYLEVSRNLGDWLAAHPPRAWVYVGSTSVYGQTDGSDVSEESPTEPVSETGRVLLATEQWLADAASRGLPVVRMRAVGIYGPGRNRIRSMHQGEARWTGDGERFMNLIHRDDLAGAVERALKSGKPGRVYNASDDAPVREREFCEWLAGRLGVAPPRWGLEGRGEIGGRSRRETNKRVRARRLMEELGWVPGFPSYREGYEALLRDEGHG